MTAAISGYDFEDQAAIELAEAATYYEQRRAGLGGRYVDAVLAAIDRAMATPGAGARVENTPEGVRERRVDGFPVAVVYRVAGDRLLVVAVSHDKRRPGYWRARLQR